MPKIIKAGDVFDDSWQLVAKDATEIPAGPVIVPLAMWQDATAELAGRDQIGVWLDSDESPALIADDVGTFAVIAINFPVFTDGRGFSYARELRERHKFGGEIRAIGNFMRDQLFYLKRCGFDAFAFSDESQLNDALESLCDFSNSYQAATDQPLPLFRRR